jgi:aldose 1-epimerase
MAEAEIIVSRQTFGKMPDGTPVELFTLSDAVLEARIINYGGILVSLKAPDRNGKPGDVVLGFDTLEQYLADNNGPGPGFFGAVIGRFANRIARGSFVLDGKKYSLPLNNGAHSLHGGPRGFHNVVWKANAIQNGVELTYLSKDGEAGYPGNLTATVRYTLAKGELRIEYSATTDKNTVVNLTNHSYFNLAGNLAGDGRGDILSHELTLRAARFTPVDAGLIPTGEWKPVAGTPFDFRKATAIGARINANDGANDGADGEQLRRGAGYDHNWVLDATDGKLAEAAEVYEPASGRLMRVLTTEPGIQLYSGNFLDGRMQGKGGVRYGVRSAFCLETQHFPDSPNQPDFPSTELKPGQRYQTTTVFRFSTR